MKHPIETDAWQTLRRFTPARIALGRAGSSMTTDTLLDFGLAHAQARDAVHVPVDVPTMVAELTAAGYASIAVHSAAADRNEYLRRPDRGRRLDEASRTRLNQHVARAPAPQLVFVIADGLSAMAVTRHAVPLLNAIRPKLASWAVGPIVVAVQARVALGDEIGELLHAQQVAVLIGERPGLSSPDSLGIYLTYAPRVGRVDAERNCLSNVRLGGLSYEQAAHRLEFLLRGACRLGRSGVDLKDESDQIALPVSHP